VNGSPLPADFVWRTALARKGLRAADVVVAPTRAHAEAVRRCYALRSLPSVVPNGRTPPVAVAAWSAAGEVFALTAGRLWDEGKNVAALDRAAGQLPIRVLAAGPLAGPNGTVATLGSVEPLGNLAGPALRALLARRPIFVSTALYEPFGLAVLEAAQAGCPLVLSDIPTFRELWDGAAEFVDARDDRALAAAILRLASDAGLRARLGRAALARSRNNTVHGMTDAMVDLYRRFSAAPAVAAEALA
jgi:glycosyltransferase involved in cell wall biosynthesis